MGMFAVPAVKTPLVAVPISILAIDEGLARIFAVRFRGMEQMTWLFAQGINPIMIKSENHPTR
ncbi:hypothetical protein [Hoeflea sp. IMCC20628]|uniref:hypothetical protein n=1 Tax=Hoeflea sp. IMCC20628 TaxID=1620421 RepID=UPI0012E06DF0|nr:hypothetical protein [Hoeflea sp. IMCC20628]